MKELLKKRYAKYIEMTDEIYSEDISDRLNDNFIFEIPSNYCIYPNYKDSHEEGYLADGYNTEKECEFIESVLDPLGYNELSECEYGWEAESDPIFTKEELVELLNLSKFITAKIESGFTSEEKDIKRGKYRQELYANMFAWTEQSMLETIEDELALFKATQLA